MLRGLPTELSPEEELSLREALPSSLKLSLAKTSNNTSLSSSSNTTSSSLTASSRPSPVQRQPLLHRLIASLTCSLFLLISFLLPYIQYLLREAYAFDRRHKLSDRALAYSMTSADALGRQALSVATNVCAMHDGRVGEAFKEAGVYVVQSFSGGVYDGLGEGMQALGLRGGWSSSSPAGGQQGYAGHGKAPWVLQWQQR
jgi:hypothetical protein